MIRDTIVVAFVEVEPGTSTFRETSVSPKETRRFNRTALSLQESV